MTSNIAVERSISYKLLWPFWILATTFSLIVAGFLGTEVGSFAVIRTAPFFGLEYIVLDSIVTGGLLGILQWFVLKRFLPITRLWILVTVLALLIADLTLIAAVEALDLFGLYPEKDLARSALFALVWGGVGAAFASIQWLTCRGQGFNYRVWTLANGVGAALGGAILPLRLVQFPERPAFDLHEEFYLYMMFAIAPTILQSVVAGYVLTAAAASTATQSAGIV